MISSSENRKKISHRCLPVRRFDCRGRSLPHAPVCESHEETPSDLPETRSRQPSAEQISDAGCSGCCCMRRSGGTVFVGTSHQYDDPHRLTSLSFNAVCNKHRNRRQTPPEPSAAIGTEWDVHPLPFRLLLVPLALISEAQAAPRNTKVMRIARFSAKTRAADLS